MGIALFGLVLNGQGGGFRFLNLALSGTNPVQFEVAILFTSQVNRFSIEKYLEHCVLLPRLSQSAEHQYYLSLRQFLVVYAQLRSKLQSDISQVVFLVVLESYFSP